MRDQTECEPRRTAGRSRLRGAARRLHRVLFYASREGRASEIAGWSNALASGGVGAASFLVFHSWPVAVCAPIIMFSILRAALTNRATVWIAGVIGTLAVASAAGALAWLFGHMIELPAVPIIAGAVVAIGSATVPAWAYRHIARRRAEHVRDSLLDPLSVPPSR